ncbi:Gfo/Idh/MocA family protein [Cyclobacterium salsum]|uniref:Gfo/Idh/MocA family protein n=1 Tax=Cyclobacterium salsum TaxID=2666329 RepID=UPI001390751A|nr:Gfo/Idh/MocA family oxidoreductase [Cyclobacterium salsum]
MNNLDRRNFLKLSTLALGGITTGLLSNQSMALGLKRNLRLGFVGIGGRGSYHLDTALGITGVEVPAICDIDPKNLYQAKRWIEESGQPSPRLYDKGPTDFIRLCEEEELDAVICATPWDTHAPVCLAAMRNGKHAACEVPIAQTLEEAWELVETFESTGKWASIVLGGFGDLTMLNMVRKGLLGDILHVESGYIHDLRMVKFNPEEEPWRLQPAIDKNGNLYPDHPMRNMMPVLDINHGDRFDYLVSMSTKSGMLNEYAKAQYGEKHPYATKEMALGDYNASLIRTVKGKMVTLNHDTHTPHPRESFRLQGTKGIYLKERDAQRIYIEGRSPKEHQWEPAAHYLAEYAHEIMKNYAPPERKGGAIRGHGSGGMTQTPINWHRLVLALQENKQPDWDVYDSVTSAAIIPLTGTSVADKSRPVDFPDFTRGKWETRPPLYS